MRSAVTLLGGILLFLTLMGIVAHHRPANTLHGQVTVDGVPVAHAAIDLFLLRPQVPGAYARTIVARTGEDGSYSFPDLPNGNYVVLVWKHGVRLYQGSVRVDRPDSVNDIAATSYRPASEGSTRIIAGVRQ
jgi:hypothetical protein